MSVYLINKSIHKIYDWLYDVSDNCEWVDINKSLVALRAVLHQLRNHLPLNESVHFSAQLPLLIKGLYFENWNPNVTSPKERSREDFLYSLKEELKMHPEIDPEEAMKGVATTLARKLSNGEITKLTNTLPKGIRSFFEEALKRVYYVE